MSQSTVKKIPNNYFDGMPVTGFHKIVFFIIMMAYFCEQMDNWNFGFIAPALMHTWGLQMSDIGVVTLWYFIGMTAGGFFGGGHLRLHRAPEDLPHLHSPHSRFLEAERFTDNFHVFVIACSMMTGFGVFCLMVCSQAYIAEMAPAESRGKWQNLVSPWVSPPCRSSASRAAQSSPSPRKRGASSSLRRRRPLTAFFVGLRYLIESRWLVARGRLKEAEQVVFEITGKHVDLSEAAKNVQTKVPVMEVLTGMFRRQYIKRTSSLLAIVAFTNPATFTVTTDRDPAQRARVLA